MEERHVGGARGVAEGIVEAGKREGFAEGEIEVSSIVIGEAIAYGKVEDAVVRNGIDQ